MVKSSTDPKLYINAKQLLMYSNFLKIVNQGAAFIARKVVSYSELFPIVLS
jgi:hypothetical protein